MSGDETVQHCLTLVKHRLGSPLKSFDNLRNPLFFNVPVREVHVRRSRVHLPIARRYADDAGVGQPTCVYESGY